MERAGEQLDWGGEHGKCPLPTEASETEVGGCGQIQGVAMASRLWADSECCYDSKTMSSCPRVLGSLISKYTVVLELHRWETTT